MTKSKTFLQIVLACAITILSVAAIASATTIGTNISTGGTLSVTGASTLSSDLTVSGNTVFSGIATSTSALVASSTFRVYGTTYEGTGTYIMSSASSTALHADLATSYGANGLFFTKANGDVWGSIESHDYANLGPKVNQIAVKKLSTDYDAHIMTLNGVGQEVAYLSTLYGIVLGAYYNDTASSADIRIFDGAGTGANRFIVDGATGDITSIGNLNLTSTGSIATSTTLVASSTFQVFGTTREGTGTFIEAVAQGTDMIGMTESNGLVFKQNDGTLWGNIARSYHTGVPGYINNFHIQDIDGDYGSVFLLYNSAGEEVAGMASWTNGGIYIGNPTTDTASTVDIMVQDGAGSNRFLVDGATGNTSIGTSSEANNLSVGVGHAATSTIDFGKPCFKMITDDGTDLYYWPCLVNCGNDGGWATSTTSCF